MATKKRFALLGTEETVTVRDAQRLWNQNQDIVFSTKYRVAGPREVVSRLRPEALADQGLITFSNFSTSQQFATEVREYTEFKKQAVKAMMMAPGAKLQEVVFGSQPALELEKGRGKSLFEKIQDLPEGKVLDVSNLKANGTGAVVRDRPSGRTKKYGSSTLPLISSDLEHFVLAVQMLPGGQEFYADQIKEVRDAISGKSERVEVISYEEGPEPFVPDVVQQGPMPFTVKGFVPKKRTKKKPELVSSPGN